MIKLKLKYKLYLGFILIGSLLVSLIPIAVFLFQNYREITIPDVQLGAFITVLVFLGLFLIMGVLYFKLLRHRVKVWLEHQYLADDLGLYSASSPILKKLVTMLIWIYPVLIVYLIVLLFSLINSSFNQLHDFFMWNLVGYGVFIVVSIVKEYIKIHFMNLQSVDNEYKLQNKKNELYAKKLKLHNTEAEKAARIKKEIEALENNLSEE